MKCLMDENKFVLILIPPSPTAVPMTAGHKASVQDIPCTPVCVTWAGQGKTVVRTVDVINTALVSMVRPSSPV